MAKATIWLDESYVKQDKTCTLYLRFYHNNKYSFIDLFISVAPKNYDKQKKRVKLGKNRKQKNLIIDEALGRAADILLKYQVNKKQITHSLFEKEFRNPSIFKDFYAFMEEQIKSRKGEVENLTIRQHLTILNKMKRFKSELLFSELTDEYLNDFRKYLKLKLKQKPATVFTAFKVIKVYINKAIKLEMMENNPFKYFKINRPKSYPDCLSIQERDILMDLYKTKTLTLSEQNVLRHFLFACYTGLRISDLRRIKHENIKNNVLNFYPKKTKNIDHRKIFVPLSKTALKLIKDENDLRIKGEIFQCYAEPTMNKKIKLIAKKAELDTNISFHVARHTFATIFLKKQNSSNAILLLQKILGHSNLKSTMIYLHVLTDELEEAIANFD